MILVYMLFGVSVFISASVSIWTVIQYSRKRKDPFYALPELDENSLFDIFEGKTIKQIKEERKAEDDEIINKACEEQYSRIKEETYEEYKEAHGEYPFEDDDEMIYYGLEYSKSSLANV